MTRCLETVEEHTMSRKRRENPEGRRGCGRHRWYRGAMSLIQQGITINNCFVSHVSSRKPIINSRCHISGQERPSYYFAIGNKFDE